MKYIIAFILLLNALTAFTQTPLNLNINAEDIEPSTKVPKGWIYGFDSAQREAYTFALDSNIKHIGNYALSIKNIGKQSTFGPITRPIFQTFEGKTITLKGYIKTQHVITGYAGLWMRIDSQFGTIAFDNMNRNPVKGTEDWKQFTIQLPYDSEKARAIHIGGLLVGEGQAWFDGFELLIDGKPIAQTPIKKVVLKKADLDTAFSKGSGIASIALSTQLQKNLEATGQLWGFLKYHHPAVANGDYNWDATLFRLLPEVIKATNNTALSTVLENFLDRLPVPKICVSCKDTLNAEVALKPDYGLLFNGSIFSKTLTDKLNYVKDNRNNKPGYYHSFMPGSGNVKFENERSYPAMVYPDAGYRLLCLYRYWSMINYYFPYKNIIGTDWNKVLSSSIPAFVNAKDETEYALTVLKLIANVQDSHANLWSGSQALNEFKGKYIVPFNAKFIADKLVITEFLSDTLDVQKKFKIGDVITTINGKPVATLIKTLQPITPGSNYDTQLRDLPSNYLLRSNATALTFNITRDGKSITQTVSTAIPAELYKQYKRPKKTSYSLLSNDIGYVYPGTYKNTDLSEIKKTFKETKGIIVDMRCYPSDFMPFTFGNYIKSTPGPFAKFSKPSSTQPGLFTYTPDVVNGNTDPENYKGKVIVIVDASSQSQAEYTTMAFQSASNVKVIGSTTAGADGNVSQINLPGGIQTMISGLGVFYPDGTETQRIGIKIDQVIKPTIKGIAEGRDELLEKAKQMILE